MKINVTIPASTSNLGPGFDTLGMALTLYNELSLSPSEKPGERVVEVDGVRVSHDPDELLAQYRSTMAEAAGIRERLKQELMAALEEKR